MEFCIVYICLILTMAESYAKKYPLNMGDVEVHLQCQSDPSTSVNYNEIRKADNRQKYNKQSVGDHALCITTKSGVQNINGDIDWSELRQQLRKYINSSSKIEETMNCVVQTNSPRETALNIFKCFFRATGAQARYKHLNKPILMVKERVSVAKSEKN